MKLLTFFLVFAFCAPTLIHAEGVLETVGNAQKTATAVQATADDTKTKIKNVFGIIDAWRIDMRDTYGAKKAELKVRDEEMTRTREAAKAEQEKLNPETYHSQNYLGKSIGNPIDRLLIYLGIWFYGILFFIFSSQIIFYGFGIFLIFYLLRKMTG